MQTWQLYIRHAHRSTSERERDNGLSDKGRAQGLVLATYLENKLAALKPRKVYSSPKQRCVETAGFVARWAGVQVIVDPRLDEQGPWEPESHFRSRLGAFFAEAREKREVCYVSHGDVLPHILDLAGYNPLEIKKGELFTLVDGKLGHLGAVHSSGNQ